MDKHPIESIMTTTMENIRDMIDVNTVIGEAITTPDGSTIIPLSRVCFGFVAGGGDYALNGDTGKQQSQSQSQSQSQAPTQQTKDLPFAGGTGAGVTVQPMGFLVVSQDQIRMMPAQHYAPIDRIIDLVPQLMCEVKRLIAAKCDQMDEEKKSEPLPPS